MPAAVSSEAVAAALTPAEGATVEAIPAQAGTSCQPAGGPPPGKAEAPAAGPAGGLPPARQSQRPWQAAPPVEAMRRVASDAYTAMRKPDPSDRAQNPLRRRHLAAPALQQRAQQWVAGESVGPSVPLLSGGIEQVVCSQEVAESVQQWAGMCLIHLVMSSMAQGPACADSAVGAFCCNAQQHSHSHLL